MLFRRRFPLIRRSKSSITSSSDDSKRYIAWSRLEEPFVNLVANPLETEADDPVVLFLRSALEVEATRRPGADILLNHQWFKR
jgi:hypothetical protein